MGRLARRAGISDAAALHRWSVEDLSGFWAAMADDVGVQWHDHAGEVIGADDRAMPGTRWFPGATLSWAEHLVRPRAGAGEAELAVVARSQTRGPVELTRAELADAVARCAAGLRSLGVARGDRVAAYLPNIPEALVAVLATASLGAVWTSCAPEFGVRAVVDRFGQVEPKVLLAVDGYRYGERTVRRDTDVAAIRDGLPSVEHVVEVPYLGTGLAADLRWDELLARAAALAFEAVPFDHPLWVLYSSGTTGRPKAIVHGHGGIVLEHLKALALHHDLGPGDRFAWFTTTGWMMWNYLIGGLATGAAIVLFDGDPAWPDLGALWRLAADTVCTVFGASAGWVMACRKAGIEPPVTALREVGSTGSPLAPAGFRWLMEAIGPGLHISSISGGTDVCTAFLGGSPLLPVRAGELSGPLLGCDAAAFDATGAVCPPGVEGELVVRSPMPSMPVSFWGDDDGSRLRSAYFEDFPGVWRHGDWVTFYDDGGAVVSGRSDATLNRGGVRLGTADFYDIVESIPEVADSLVVHLDGDRDELWLFLVPSGDGIDDDVRAGIVERLRRDLSPRHVPDRIEVVPAIPRTLSGKKLELPVKRVLRGTGVDEAASLDSLVDPDALRYFERLRPPGTS